MRAQQVMKSQADKKRKEGHFKVGDKVLVRLQPYKQHSAVLRKNHKLSMRYFGPFPVIDKIGALAYKLQLPTTAKIHPVFHISQLKEFKGTDDEPYIPLPLTTSEIGPMMKPTAVLDTRMLIQGNQTIPQVLIQWGEHEPAEAKWEDFKEVCNHYPDFNLEDKVEFKGGGIVMKERPRRNEDSARGGPTNFFFFFFFFFLREGPTNLEGIRRGNRTRVLNTRLKGYKVGM
jgi:hypothetical protein